MTAGGPMLPEAALMRAPATPRALHIALTELGATPAPELAKEQPPDRVVPTVDVDASPDDVNSAIVVGTVEQLPAPTYYPADVPRLTFALTTVDRRGRADTHHIVIFGAPAAAARSIVTPRTRLYVRGSMRVSQYDMITGEKRRGVEVHAREVKPAER